MKDWLHTLRRDMTDPSFRTAVLLGLVSVPLTVALSWELVVDPVQAAGGTFQGIPLIVAAVIAGYLYHDRAEDRVRVGLITGIMASLAIAILYLSNVVTTLGAESWVSWVALIATPILLVLGVALCGVIGMVGAIIGDWMRARFSGIIPIPKSS